MIASVFEEWVGWGWGLAGIVWLLGGIFILGVVDKRLRSRLHTALVFVVWTMAVLVIAGSLYGYKPPS